MNIIETPKNGNRHKVTIQYEEYEHSERDVTPTKEDKEFTYKSIKSARRSLNFGNDLNLGYSCDRIVREDFATKNLFFPAESYRLDDLYDWEDKRKQTFKSHSNIQENQRGGTVVKCNEKTLALFRFGSIVYAIDDKCPHAGGPLHVGDIEVIGEARVLCVVCPWHKWRIELCTGKLRMPPGRDIRNQVYPTRILEDGVIEIGFGEIAADYFSGQYDF